MNYVTLLRGVFWRYGPITSTPITRSKGLDRGRGYLRVPSTVLRNKWTTPFQIRSRSAQRRLCRRRGGLAGGCHLRAKARAPLGLRLLRLPPDPPPGELAASGGAPRCSCKAGRARVVASRGQPGGRVHRVRRAAHESPRPGPCRD